MLEEIKKTAAFLREATHDYAPEVGIVLGTGLGGFADGITTRYAIDYKDIPGFPVSTVEGHRGRLIFGEVEGRRVVAMQGRFHYYEGYSMQQVTFPIRVMQQLGIRFLFVSNASGGINTSFRTGDLMVITDHINLMPNPLIGPNLAELGPRFPDMHNCYDRDLIAAATRIAEEEGIKLQYGVYVGGTGPTFETQAEYRYFKAIGGDAAGMSTVPEVIVARHMSVPVFGDSGHACGINTSFRTGDLMVITDHINLMPNPLIGPNLAELGPRFPDMHNCYDRDLIAAATRIAEEEGIKLQYGVYVGGTGPTFETQAEYRYFKAIGGDAAGMSTVPEVIVARHMSVPVFGVSVITNCGLSDEVGDHEDVQRQGRRAGAKMEVLFRRMIQNL